MPCMWMASTLTMSRRDAALLRFSLVLRDPTPFGTLAVPLALCPSGCTTRGDKPHCRQIAI
eukprot:1452383-Pleurochrysis_carterae.AAC.2